MRAGHSNRHGEGATVIAISALPDDLKASSTRRLEQYTNRPRNLLIHPHGHSCPVIDDDDPRKFEGLIGVQVTSVRP